MKIIVLNGSPKGELSITMQYINYIQKKFKHHDLKIINIAQRINQIEKDAKAFEEIIKEIQLSDGVIWAFPLYVCTVHSSYQRFIELIFERAAEYAFSEKYTAVLTTSIHFFDNTAVNYMNSICDDLNMNYADSFTPEMYDLQKEAVRKNLLQFAQNLFDSIENKIITSKNYSPVRHFKKEYSPEASFDKIDSLNKKVILVADSLEDINLKNMIDKFTTSFSTDIEVVNLQDIDIKGGCLGCLKCGYNYECAYTDKDDFISFYNSKLKTADIIVFAGAIKYRYLSYAWKRFLDRAFFNTHTPMLSDTQIGFIISGPLMQIPNLRQILESYVQFQGANLVGFVTDEYDSNIAIDKQLYGFSLNLIKFSMTKYKKPFNFLGIAGMKLFRDEVWGNLRFPFVADHKAYKALNVYDFPQRNYKARIKNLILILMCKIPKVRKEIYSEQIKPSMILSLKKIVDDPAT